MNTEENVECTCNNGRPQGRGPGCLELAWGRPWAVTSDPPIDPSSSKLTGRCSEDKANDAQVSPHRVVLFLSMSYCRAA